MSRTMKSIFRAGSFILAIVIVSTGLGQGQAPSHKLAISVAKTVVKAGSKIRLKIEFTNTSNHDIDMTAIPMGNEDHPEVEGFRPVVLDAQGKRPPMTRWGKQVFGRLDPDQGPLALNAVTPFHLKPGKVYTSEIVLSDLYDLSVPGTYTVQVPDYDEDLKQATKSNATTITVVP